MLPLKFLKNTITFFINRLIKKAIAKELEECDDIKPNFPPQLSTKRIS